MSSLQHYPLGAAVPDSPHAVCSSLPTMADIIGYEEKSPETLAALKAGYPRFISHPFVRKLTEWLQHKHGWQERHVFVLCSMNAVPEMLRFVGVVGAGYEEVGDGMVAVHFPKIEEAWLRARNFLQHTGVCVSSRQAEDVLLREGELEKAFPEEAHSDPFQAEEMVRMRLAAATGALPEEVVLCSSGMNAFWSIFQSAMEFQRMEGRGLWVQVGWCYVDTRAILDKFLTGDGEGVVSIFQAQDTVALEKVFAEKGKKIAGVVCECPTNPLIQTPDVERISRLCREHGALCVLDPSIAGCLNVNPLPLADVVPMSLTKYAANAGDVMLGALVLNRESPFALPLADRLGLWREMPYGRDVQRLAKEMENWEPVTQQLNENARKLAAWLSNHPKVKKVWWAGEASSAENFQQIARSADACGSVLSVELTMPLADFYDRLRMVKGPSFGTRFTMACPFMYLAHYPMASTEEGRAALEKHGLNPDLVRLSVGQEPFEEIQAAVEEALG